MSLSVSIVRLQQKALRNLQVRHVLLSVASARTVLRSPACLFAPHKAESVYGCCMEPWHVVLSLAQAYGCDACQCCKIGLAAAAAAAAAAVCCHIRFCPTVTGVSAAATAGTAGRTAATGAAAWVCAPPLQQQPRMPPPQQHSGWKAAAAAVAVEGQEEAAGGSSLFTPQQPIRVQMRRPGTSSTPLTGLAGWQHTHVKAGSSIPTTPFGKGTGKQQQQQEQQQQQQTKIQQSRETASSRVPNSAVSKDQLAAAKSEAQSAVLEAANEHY